MLVTQAPAQSQEPAAAKRLDIPPWAEVMPVNAVDRHPLDRGGRAFSAALGGLPISVRPGSGSSAGIQVNLATGVESYLPAPDLTTRNPSEIVFQRSFRSDRALQGYSSPGLSPGWVHNFDVVMQPVEGDEGWTELSITYPSGERDYVKPVLDGNGAPTGKFQIANHAPIVVSGLPGQTVNTWESIKVEWKDAVWQFAPFGKKAYALAAIDDLKVEWDSKRALKSVKDTGSGAALLTLTYTPQGHLHTAFTNTGITRTYAFGIPEEGGSKSVSLLMVSQLGSLGEEAAQAQWAYGYADAGGNPFLSAISVPSPAGDGISTTTIRYQQSRVAAHVDANGIARRYTYTPNHTRVEVVNAAGTVESFWTQNLDEKNRNIGVTDAEGHSTKIEYEGGQGK